MLARYKMSFSLINVVLIWTDSLVQRKIGDFYIDYMKTSCTSNNYSLKCFTVHKEISYNDIVVGVA